MVKVQTKYQVTNQTNIIDWIDRHTARISRLKLVLKDTKKNQGNDIKLEILERKEHLKVLVVELTNSLKKIKDIM